MPSRISSFLTRVKTFNSALTRCFTQGYTRLHPYLHRIPCKSHIVVPPSTESGRRSLALYHLSSWGYNHYRLGL